MASLNEIQEALNDVFVLVDKDKPTERFCFSNEYMKTENTVPYSIYQAISDVQQASGLSFDFSYVIAKKAVDILAELEDWDNDDAIAEAVDGSVPIYTNELMTIYAHNGWAVDEAEAELGFGGDTSMDRAKGGWYLQIQQMTQAIKTNLLKLVGDE